MDINKLQIFDSKSVSGKSTSSPIISVNPTSGVINLNASLVKDINLEDGQQVAFSRDKETGNWYLMKVLNEATGGFVVRVYLDKGKATFSCKSLVLELLKDHKIKGNDAQRFSVDTEHPSPAGDYMCYDLDFIKKAIEGGK